MSKKTDETPPSADAASISNKAYKDNLHKLQIETDPLKQWKISPIDDQAIKHWKAYSLARNGMLARTHNPVAPCTLVRADDKHLARLNIIKDLLSRLHYTNKDKRLIQPDAQNRLSLRCRKPRERPACEVSQN